MERKFRFAVNEHYHVFSRGVEKRKVFLDNSDKDRFIKLLYACNSQEPVVFKSIEKLRLDEIKRGETITDMGAYCLMPNHFHLLVKEKQECGISDFMEKTLTAYSMYFNKKYDRTGRLFETNFKAIHANTDEYLKYLFSYIHLNPVAIVESDWRERGVTDKEMVKNYLKSYKYSSFPEYCGCKREENLILNKSAFPEYFEDYSDFEYFIEDWLSFNEPETEEPEKISQFGKKNS